MEKTTREVFQENLNRIWEDQDLSEAEFAEKVGVYRTYGGKLRRGESDPSFDIIDKICEGLGVTRADLLLNKNEKTK